MSPSASSPRWMRHPSNRPWTPPWPAPKLAPFVFARGSRYSASLARASSRREWQVRLRRRDQLGRRPAQGKRSARRDVLAAAHADTLRGAAQTGARLRRRRYGT